MPQGLRQRVRNYEQHRWMATWGIDEGDMIQSLPEGLRRDIKYHLCLDFVRQVDIHLTYDTYTEFVSPELQKHMIHHIIRNQIR